MPIVLLINNLPSAGFQYPRVNNITTRARYDKAIQAAIRDAGIRYCRPVVTKLMITIFEIAAVTVNAVYVPDGDASAIMAVYGAIDVTHHAHEVAWAHNLQPSIFHQLVLGIRAARRLSLKTLGVDDAETGSWAAMLGAAVDAFDEALARRGWSGSGELRALEGGGTDAEEAVIRQARAASAALGTPRCSGCSTHWT